jgi:hypothetical protein
MTRVESLFEVDDECVDEYGTAIYNVSEKDKTTHHVEYEKECLEVWRQLQQICLMSLMEGRYLAQLYLESYYELGVKLTYEKILWIFYHHKMAELDDNRFLPATK